MPENILTNFQYSRQQQRYTTVPTVEPTLPVLTGATQTGYTESDNMVLGNFSDTDLLNGEIFLNDQDNRVFIRSDDEILEFVMGTGATGTDNYTTGATLDGTTVYFDRTDALSAYTVDLSSIAGGGGSGDTFVTGFTYDNANTFTISRNNGEPDLDVNFSTMTGLTVNGTVSATTIDASTILSGGTNLLSIFTSPLSNKYVETTGFSAFTSQVITHNLNTSSPIVQLIDSTGNLVIPDSVSAYTLNTVTVTVSCTDSFTVIVDGGGSSEGPGTTANTYTTGFTYDNANNITLSQNEGQADKVVNISTMTGLTVNGTVSATTVDVGDILSGGTNLNAIFQPIGVDDSYTTGTTLVGTTLYFDRSDVLSAYTADLSSIAGGGGLWSGSTGLNSLVPNNQSNTASGDYSLAGGGNSTASGTSSFAWGSMAFATGVNSFAFGTSPSAQGNGSVVFGPNIVSGDNSFSIGGNNNVSGTNSAAFGGQTVASGNQSFVAGSSSNATGTASAAFGGMCTAAGDSSFAAGNGNSANGNSSTVFGSTSIAFGFASFAGGNFGSASGSTSFAYGDTAIADADRSVVLGGYFNWVKEGATGSTILGGTGNTVTSAATNSVILGCSDITATTSNTVYACNIEANNYFSGGTNLNDIFQPIGASSSANTYTVVRHTSGSGYTFGTNNTVIIASDETTTVTLPATPQTNIFYVVKVRQDATLYPVTVEGNGNDIDGNTSILINTGTNPSYTFIYDGTEFVII